MLPPSRCILSLQPVCIERNSHSTSDSFSF
ncbi:ras homolog gene family, member T2, isoform CRA_b [Rattus norvegicus]|uniref:Ras homolog gene family, member T2, isoform CRA_b n=1 Tax=Rattus norvegicus TaxID=10116 RepID=A6HD67_RAT|nr:ras homolog gene family, member T2, isoform CRA_b [Rattus norvegicus]